MDRRAGLDISVVVAAEIIALAGAAADTWWNGTSVVALAIVSSVALQALLAPLRWKGTLSQRDAQRFVVLLSAGLFWDLLVAAYAGAQPNSFPRAALVAGAISVHLVAVWLLVGGLSEDLYSSGPWVAASAAGIVGVLTELPTVRWNTVTFTFAGLACGLALGRMRLRAGRAPT